MNAKNQLFEILQNLGCSETCAAFTPTSCSSGYCSTLVITFPDRRQITGTGNAQRRTDAEIVAAQDAIQKIRAQHPDLCVDWDKIYCQAQAGDALIKLSVYLSTEQKKAHDKSLLLQSLESDSRLARVFDLWASQGEPGLSMWGSDLSEKRKATLVEALLWRRFGEQVISGSAIEHLQFILNLLSAKVL